MCGLVGFYSVDRRMGAEEAQARLRAMTRRLSHRGPDAEGFRFVRDGERTVLGMGHRRLSIIDVTAAGSQPMMSHDGRYLIALNGEIYNFPDLKREIDSRRGGAAWKGCSDTEVLLELVSDLGLLPALDRLDGMFAFALYDRVERSLALVRDRFGEKPLYYGLSGGALLFGSELRALEAWPGISLEQDPQAVSDYFRYGYVPAPASVYAGFLKLPAASILQVRGEDLKQALLPKPQHYWDMVGAALSATVEGLAGSQAEAESLIEDVLFESTRRRMVSDVPLGALLSGGVDSTLVTAMMQRASPVPVHTFTIGITESGYDESVVARKVSAHLGTRHTELMLSPAEVQVVIPDIAKLYDEPFADSSQVPTYLVSRMARQSVTVALSGDGGDELFAGYNRYFAGPRLWSRFSVWPHAFRRVGAAALRSISPGTLNRAIERLGRLAPRELAAGRGGEKLHKMARVLDAASLGDFHGRLLEVGRPDLVLQSPMPNRSLTTQLDVRADRLDFASRAMLLDTANYLPDDILTKVDRASMAVGLETRTPFLSREVFRLAWRMPTSMKVSSTQGKLQLRNIVYRYVPKELMDRPKSGFALPIGRWMRGPLREWVEAQLSPSALSSADMFDVGRIRALWLEHLSGKRDHETLLWTILMYQGWRRGAVAQL